MAELSTENRQRIWRGLMRFWSKNRTMIAVSKPDLQAAVNALDTWTDDNQAVMNNALPVAARTGLTLEQKSLLFCSIVLARANTEMLRQVIGETD